MITDVPARTPGARIFGLDLLRAAAILGVVCAHGFVVLYPHFGAAVGIFGHGGFYGVELFFVLSGFLIGQILIREGMALAHAGNIARFYLRRWFRTLPLFFLFVAVNVWLEAQWYQHRIGLGEALSHAFFLRNLTALRLTFFPESWSLAVEEWFYLAFPVALWVTLKFWRKFETAFCVTAGAFFLLSTGLRMSGALSAASTWAEAQRMVVVYRFDALMIGMFGAWLSLQHPRAWSELRRIVAFLGAILLVAMYATLWKIEDHHLAFGADSYFARTFRFTCVSLGFALLLPWASAWKLARENFASTAVRRIALWSYALYLVHLPVFAFVSRAMFPDTTASSTAALACFFAQVGGAIALSALLHYFYEAPFLRLRELLAPRLQPSARPRAGRAAEPLERSLDEAPR